MVTREQAVELFHKYNKSESLWHHALCVEAVMRAFAAEAGEHEGLRRRSGRGRGLLGNRGSPS